MPDPIDADSGPEVDEPAIEGLGAAFLASDEDYAPFDPRESSANQPAGVVGEDTDKVVEFDPRYKDSFEGLLFIGSLRKRFKWMGHEFVIRTLCTNEVLEVGLVAKPYQESLGEIKAYQAAVVAASILSVDGKPPPIPITDEDSPLESKFFYVVNHWQPVVIDMIYGQVMSLEVEVNNVLASMGKAVG